MLPDAQLDLCPMADGGEGTVDALVAATGGRIERRRVTGPLPEMKVDAAFGVLGDGTTAVIEMAAASGLALLKPEDRNPLNTTTFGTGELLDGRGNPPRHPPHPPRHRRQRDVRRRHRLRQACGLPIILEGGEPVAMTEPLCGRDLASVVLVKHGRGSPVERVKITVACDVTNPLYGPNGAAPVFGPQKGATPDVVRELDDALRRLAARLGKQAEAETPGAGAAGGLGFGMLAFFGATLRSGFDIVSDATRLRERLAGADLCITGEGRLDASSRGGKTVAGVARLCRSMNVPCVALVGAFGEGFDETLEELDLEAHAITPAGMGRAERSRRPPDLLSAAAARVADAVNCLWVYTAPAVKMPQTARNAGGFATGEQYGWEPRGGGGGVATRGCAANERSEGTIPKGLIESYQLTAPPVPPGYRSRSIACALLVPPRGFRRRRRGAGEGGLRPRRAADPVRRLLPLPRPRRAGPQGGAAAGHEGRRVPREGRRRRARAGQDRRRASSSAGSRRTIPTNRCRRRTGCAS